MPVRRRCVRTARKNALGGAPPMLFALIHRFRQQKNVFCLPTKGVFLNDVFRLPLGSPANREKRFVGMGVAERDVCFASDVPLGVMCAFGTRAEHITALRPEGATSLLPLAANTSLAPTGANITLQTNTYYDIIIGRKAEYEKKSTNRDL